MRESATRTFLCALEITDQIEQESVDISVYGSADGQEWEKMPLLKMQQEFYRGLTRQVLDLTFRPEVKFLREVGTGPLGPRSADANVRPGFPSGRNSRLHSRIRQLAPRPHQPLTVDPTACSNWCSRLDGPSIVWLKASIANEWLDNSYMWLIK